MAENLGDHFDGHTGSKGYSGGEGVAANVGSDGFLYATTEGEGFEIAVIHVVGEVWQLAVVAVEYFDHWGKENQGEWSASLESCGHRKE